MEKSFQGSKGEVRAREVRQTARRDGESFCWRDRFPESDSDGTFRNSTWELWSKNCSLWEIANVELTISIRYPFQSFAPLSPLEYPKCRDVDPLTYGSGKGRGMQCSDLGCSEAPPKGMGPANFDDFFTVLEYLKPRDLINTWKALLEGCKTCFFCCAFGLLLGGTFQWKVMCFGAWRSGCCWLGRNEARLAGVGSNSTNSHS